MQDQQMEQNMGMGSGLTRYRSAPSSCFASLLDSGGGFGSDEFERLFNPRASSPETQIIFSRFMNSGGAQARKIEPCELQSNDYSTFGNKDSEIRGQNKIQRFGTGPTDSPLIRHSSSPAGLFANVHIDEFGTVRALGNIGGGNNAGNSASFCSTSSSSNKTFKMDPITEIEAKEAWDDNNNDFPINSSWDDHNNDFLDHQKSEGGNRAATRLSHHLSLPKSFGGELSSMEKLLQDSVPCKIRAKRGCATHPRSIAERVRRTKISERMRKLQELVPNMEKQTNTSDMLDLAVEYIKDLQGQLKTLCDDREKCSCEAKLGP